MRAVGIDIATSTGIAYADDSGTQSGNRIELPDLRGMQRVQLVAANVANLITTWEPDRIVIEGYAYTKNISSFVVLVELGTAIRLALRRLNRSWYVVTPSGLKKWTTGKGNADKEAMAQAVWHRWCFKSPSHDIVDAVALAHLGLIPEAELLQIPGTTVNS